MDKSKQNPERNAIIVDLDSSVHEYMHTVALVALNDFGIHIEHGPRDWAGVFTGDVDRHTQIDIFQRCHDREYIFLTNPYPGAVDALNEMASMGYEIHYFTDRKNEAAEDTEEWLTHHGFPDPHYLMCCRDKREDMRYVNHRIATVIDDRPRTLCFSRTELGLNHAFSIRHSYNQNLTDIPGIHLFDTWPEILEKFKEVEGDWITDDGES